MKIEGKKSLIKKEKLKSVKSIKERREEAKNPNNNNIFLKVKQPKSTFPDNICLSKNNNNDFRNNNNNLFIYTKKYFLKSNQIVNKKIEDYKRYKKDLNNSYKYNNKRFDYDKIEKLNNLDNISKEYNKTIDKKKNSYSQINSGK